MPIAGASGVNPRSSFLLYIFAWISLGVAFLGAVVIAANELRHPQKMVVMNIVWPVSALYFSVIAVWAYWSWGRATSNPHPHQRPPAAVPQSGSHTGPSFRQVAVGTSHCGAGCAIADVICEFVIAAAGITLLGSPLWAEFAIDFAAAWALGIVFQYFALKPMRNLTVRQTIVAAIKADTLSILAFQVGMYAWMTLVYFALFRQPHLTPFDPRYWLMMQIGMICGFATSLPMNWFLLRKGLKEAM
jgi:hypothetical protein